MSLSLSQLMPDAARAALIAERFEAYEVRAAVFLHQQLAWVVRDMGEAALHHAITESYARSSAAGLRSEADHLKYLYAAAYWGIGFETDPQYATPLAEAGYRPASGERPAYLPIEPVLNALDRWQQPLRAELAQPQASLQGLLGLADGPARPPHQLAAQIASIWPERCGRLTGDQILAVIEAARLAYAEVDAPQNAPAVHAAMALHLGSAFGGDPFLPWRGQAAPGGFALIHGLINYWKKFGQAAQS